MVYININIYILQKKYIIYIYLYVYVLTFTIKINHSWIGKYTGLVPWDRYRSPEKTPPQKFVGVIWMFPKIVVPPNHPF